MEATKAEGLLELLQKCNANLETVQKALWGTSGYGSKSNHQGTTGLLHVSIYQGSILGAYF